MPSSFELTLILVVLPALFLLALLRGTPSGSGSIGTVGIGRIAVAWGEWVIGGGRARPGIATVVVGDRDRRDRRLADEQAAAGGDDLDDDLLVRLGLRRRPTARREADPVDAVGDRHRRRNRLEVAPGGGRRGRGHPDLDREVAVGGTGPLDPERPGRLRSSVAQLSGALIRTTWPTAARSSSPSRRRGTRPAPARRRTRSRPSSRASGCCLRAVSHGWRRTRSSARRERTMG